MAERLMTEAEALASLKFQDALQTATPKVFVTPAMIAINVLVFILMAASGVSLFEPTTDSLIRWGADFAPITMHGEWWRVVSSTFVHIGLIHILMNMYVLFAVGRLTERLYGNAGFAVLYILSGIGGSLLSLVCHPATVSAGASGAVFGAYGGLVAFVLLQSDSVPGHTVNALLKSASIFVGINLFYGLTQEGVDVAAHIGGIVTGFIVGGFLSQPLLAPSEVRMRRAAVVGFSGLAAVMAGALGFPAPAAAQGDWMRATMSSPSIQVGSSDRVYYSGSATKENAESLGKALQADGFFQNKGAEVLLSKGGAGAAVSWRVKDSAWNDEHYLSLLDDFGHEIAAGVGSTPFTIRIYDSGGREKQIAVK